MAEVWRSKGFVFHIYSNDHDPPHVHVYKAGERVVILLGDSKSGPEVRESWMSRPQVGRALSLVKGARKDLLEKWKEIHG